MTGTLPAFGVGNLSFSVKRHGTVSTASPLCASAIRVRQQNGLKRRSASTPAKSYIVIAMARPSTAFAVLPHYAAAGPVTTMAAFGLPTNPAAGGFAQKHCHSGGRSAARQPGTHEHRPLEYGFRVPTCCRPRN